MQAPETACCLRQHMGGIVRGDQLQQSRLAPMMQNQPPDATLCNLQPLNATTATVADPGGQGQQVHVVVQLCRSPSCTGTVLPALQNLHNTEYTWQQPTRMLACKLYLKLSSNSCRAHPAAAAACTAMQPCKYAYRSVCSLPGVEQHAAPTTW